MARLFGNDDDNRLTGTGVADLIYGRSGDDRLYGLGGNDTIDGGEGNDSIWAGEGANRVFGGEGNDRIWAGAGSDVILAGEGNDTVSAGAGNNRVTGGEGDDAITSGGGRDTISGDDGNDRIASGGGNDILAGGEGDDVMAAAAGADRLTGGEGNDVLDGGLGNDTMTGGEGADRFVFAKGLDRITDFENGDDRIDLRGVAGLDSFAELRGAASQNGADVVLTFGADRLVIEDFRLNQMDGDDFLWWRSARRSGLGQVVADPFPGLRQVAAEDGRQPVGVARLQGRDDGFVFGHGMGPSLGSLVADEADALQARLQAGMDLGQGAVVGQGHDGAVDGLVQLVIGQPVAALIAVQHPVMQRPHLRDPGVARLRAGDQAGLLLQHADDLEHVAHLAGAELLDHRAACRDQLDQPLGGQILDRLAQRRAGHAQLLADLALVQAGAGRQGALDDHVAQPGQDRVQQGLALDPGIGVGQVGHGDLLEDHR